MGGQLEQAAGGEQEDKDTTRAPTFPATSQRKKIIGFKFTIA